LKLWEFNKLKTLPNSFLFYGDEFFLDLQYNVVKDIVKNTNIVKLYFDEFDIDLAKNHLAQNSLFGDKNSLIIKTNKWIDVEKLLQIVGDNYFYLFFYGDTKKVKTKKFGKNFVRFFKPDLRDMIIQANSYMAQKSITNIDLEHLKYLISKVDYRFLFNEIDKISLIDKISNSLIDELVFNYNETGYDDVFDKLFMGFDYLKELDYLLYQGEDEIVILNALTRYVRTLYMFNLHIKNIGYENVSKDVLGYQIPKNLEENRKKISFNIKDNQFLELFTILLEAELAIKSSKDKNSYLFKTFIDIKTIL
jgi:DNA polymerase-3 subunit delta